MNELRFSNIFVEKRSSSYLQSLDLSRLFLLDTKENPRLCRGEKKAYGVEESRKEKVSKLE